MPANNGWTFGAGLANGRNFRNQILKEAEASRNRKKFDSNYDQFMKKHNSGNQDDGVYISASGKTPTQILNDASMPNGVGIGANENGVYGVQPTFNQGEGIGVSATGQPIQMPDYSAPNNIGIGVSANGAYGIGSPSVANFPRRPDSFGQALAKAEPQVDRYPQELVGLTGEDLQRAGQAYNQWIDGGRVGNFGQVLQNAENAVAPAYTPAAQVAPQYSAENVDDSYYNWGENPAPNADQMRQIKGDNNVHIDDSYYDWGSKSNPAQEAVQNKTQQKSGYKPITDFYGYNKQIRDNYYPQGVQYNKDPNNPSFVDKIVDWYRGL